MKVLVTGSTGFIGINLSLQLAKQGYIVHALYRTEAKTIPLKHENIILFKGNINDIDSLEIAMRGCDAVFHLAAYAKVWAKDKNTFYNINFVGTDNVLKVAQILKIKKIVVTSSAAVFGPSINHIVDENTTRQVPYFNEYEETKALSEELVKKYISEGMYIVIVNPTRVFGPGLLSDSNSISKMIMMYCNGKLRIIPGNGKSIGNYAYVDDVVSGHILALEKGESGERYILGGNNMTYIDLFNQLSQITGRKYRLFKLPLFTMLTISWCMLLMSKLFKIPPLITPPWVKKYNNNWELSSEKAINNLGYQVTPINVTIAETIKYLKKNKLIK